MHILGHFVGKQYNAIMVGCFSFDFLRRGLGIIKKKSLLGKVFFLNGQFEKISPESFFREGFFS